MVIEKYSVNPFYPSVVFDYFGVSSGTKLVIICKYGS